MWRRTTAFLLLLACACAAVASAAPEPGSLLGWGDASYGALGLPVGDTIATPSPVALPAEAGPLVSVAVSRTGAVAATASGAVYAWDQGGGPRKVAVTGSAVQVAAGGFDSYALTSAGDLYGWGDNTFGELAQPGGGSSSLPIHIQLPLNATGTITRIAAGIAGASAYAVTSTGELWDWGLDDKGQLGRPIPSQSPSDGQPTPARVTDGGLGAEKVVDVTGGIEHALVQTAGGRVWAFGDDSLGQTGQTPTSTPQATPKAVSLPLVITVHPFPLRERFVIPQPFVSAIAAGSYHSAAIANGRVYTWGENSQGQLGRTTPDDTTGSAGLPLLPTGSGTPVSVSGGPSSTYVTTDSGAVVDFGSNAGKQLGTPAAGDSAIVPVFAALPDGTTVGRVASGFPSDKFSSSAAVLAIVSDVAVATGALPGAHPGVPYATTLAAAGQGPLSWSAAGLPDWLKLDAATGALTGTPPAEGSVPLTITVADRFGVLASRALTLGVTPVPVPVAPGGGSSGGASGGGASAGNGGGGGAAGTGGAGTTVPAPGRVSLTRLRHSGATLTLSLTCAQGGGSCTGAVAVARRAARKAKAKAKAKTPAPLATKSYTIVAGRAATLTITIDKAGRAALKRAHRLAVTVTLKPASGAAVSRTLTLVPAKPKTRKKTR